MTQFTEFFTKLREDLDDARRDRQQFCQETRNEVHQWAERTRANLAEFATDLCNARRAFRRCR